MKEETGFITSYTINNGSIRQFTVSNISVEELYIVQVVMANAIGNSSTGEIPLIARRPDVEPTIATTETNSYLTGSGTGNVIKHQKINSLLSPNN